MANKVCTVLVIALAMFGRALAKPGYAAGYAVDYYVSVIYSSDTKNVFVFSAETELFVLIF